MKRRSTVWRCSPRPEQRKQQKGPGARTRQRNMPCASGSLTQACAHLAVMVEACRQEEVDDVMRKIAMPGGSRAPACALSTCADAGGPQRPFEIVAGQENMQATRRGESVGGRGAGQLPFASPSGDQGCAPWLPRRWLTLVCAHRCVAAGARACAPTRQAHQGTGSSPCQ